MPHSDAFDVIPYQDIKGGWKKLGSGSFGNVYRGSYLGIDVAIKEVLPSSDYDVAKYFEREWRLMKECRHPNICLFIGLSRAPQPDNRIFIVSEFVDGGNVRQYIYDKKNKPFSWPIRLSFATDVARALAYLHARKCIHRDLKGENLLVTSNGRIKITDFGFARISPRNEEESRRLTFCGTDSYMSPEILKGEEFGVGSDVFSLGIIFCEIAARRLADDRHFKRVPPEFGVDAEELYRLADSDCPEGFLRLCLDCCEVDPAKRPTTRDILDRLREIEAEVLARPAEGENINIGSIRFANGDTQKKNALRIPSFGLGKKGADDSGTSESEDEELIEAVRGLAGVGLNVEGNEGRTGTVILKSAWSESSFAAQGGGMDDRTPTGSVYSTTVVRGHNRQTPALSASAILNPVANNANIPPQAVYSDRSRVQEREEADAEKGAASVMTVRGSPKDGGEEARVSMYSTASVLRNPFADPEGVDPLAGASQISIATMDSYRTGHGRFQTADAGARYGNVDVGHAKYQSADAGVFSEYGVEGGTGHSRYRTADTSVAPSVVSSTYATEGGSTLRSLAPVLAMHRFTLVKPGMKPRRVPAGYTQSHGVESSGGRGIEASATSPAVSGIGMAMSVWNPLEIFFSSALLITKCDICAKRIGWRPFMECDDCGLKTHVKCGDLAPRDCGIRNEHSATEKGYYVAMPGGL